MEVLRDTDGSVTFTFTRDELGHVTSGHLDADVDRLKWHDFAEHFISFAKGHDPEGDFSLIEDFSKTTGITIGYTALRYPPIAAEPVQLPPMNLPEVDIELPPAEIPALALPEAVIEAAFAEVG